MGIPERDAASQFKGVQAVTVANGAAYDGSALDGETIDRSPGAGQQYLSCKFLIETGSGTASDVVQFTLYESADDSTWSEVTDETLPALNEAAEFETYDVDLSDRERYIRLELDAADQTVDSTIDVAAYCLLAGAKEQPATDA
jgi:hypothetical protein